MGLGPESDFHMCSSYCAHSESDTCTTTMLLLWLLELCALEWAGTTLDFKFKFSKLNGTHIRTYFHRTVDNIALHSVATLTRIAGGGGSINSDYGPEGLITKIATEE
jgi:hypothetical protein